jgi:hypothetical protein
MNNPKGRPKTYGGTQVGIRLNAMLDLRIRSEAQRSGRTISQLVRDTLLEKWGDEAKEPQN